MAFRKTIFSILIALLFLVLFIGCTTNPFPDPVTPATSDSVPTIRDTDNSPGHNLLGFFECRLDPDTEILEFVPLRYTQLHLNALRFMEPPPPVNVTLSNFAFVDGVIDVDVSLVHPFAGLDQFTGFDVCGIVITSGNITGFSDPDIVIAGEGETRLTNPDGLTRWWNPVEFPFNPETPVFGYIDGILGTPDSVADFSATLNGYKYHADSLDADDSVSDLDTSTRGSFSAGATNTRHYTIEIDSGLVFNYAVDALWAPPDNNPPVVPDDFPPDANREVPYFLEITITDNTLAYVPSTGTASGDLELDVTCYDWFDADQNTVRVEVPGVFDPVISDTPTGGTSTCATYHLVLSDPVLDSSDPIDVWVSAEKGTGYEGLLPGKPTSTWLPAIQASVTELTGEVVLIWNDEIPILHASSSDYNDIEAATISDGLGNTYVSFFYWFYWLNCWESHPLYVTSTDFGHTFGAAISPAFPMHDSMMGVLCSNNKYSLGSGGHAFMSCNGPDGQTIQATPPLSTTETSYAYNGTIVENAGEMLFTSTGNPMMFGDLGGTILMRMGDIPNIAGTGDWPDYIGTEYALVAEALINYVSVSRCTGLTSDGRAHLMFTHGGGCPFIRMVSSIDATCTSWDPAVSVFDGLAEVWVGGDNPGMWIDDNDGFHVVWAGEYWWDEFELMYGYSADGTDWNEMTSFTPLGKFPLDDGLNDTQIVMFDAFGETWQFICYETAGDVYCLYRNVNDEEFSDPIKVNDHPDAALPDIYPNGDTGVLFVYQADDGSGQSRSNVYCHLAEFVIQ